MNRDKIIEAWTEVGRCEADEHALGVQFIELTHAQRKAHEATRSARDIAENFLTDINISTKALYSGGLIKLSDGDQPLKAIVKC